jgi:hypothetical protein
MRSALPILAFVLLAGCHGGSDIPDSVAVSVAFGPVAYAPYACDVEIAVDIETCGSPEIIDATWIVVSAPESPWLDDPRSACTVAYFPVPGEYVLAYRIRYYADGSTYETICSATVTIVAYASYG